MPAAAYAVIMRASLLRLLKDAVFYLLCCSDNCVGYPPLTLTINRFTMEFLDLAPVTRAQGTVQLPGSKSISNRTLLLAALAKGETDIRDLLKSDDTDRMLEALAAL